VFTHKDIFLTMTVPKPVKRMIQTILRLKKKNKKGAIPLSLIIPALNEEDYIGLLLSSLTEQTYTNFEVIVVDGRSIDHTINVVSSFQEKLPKLTTLIADKRNPGYQRNIGARQSIHPLIVFLDADVIAPPQFLEEVVSRMQKRGADIATCWCIPAETGQKDKVFLFLHNIGIGFSKYIWPIGWGANMVIKRDLFERLDGFDERIAVGEDQDLYQRAVKKGAHYHIFMNPQVQLSMRRLRRDGYMKYGLKLLKSFYYVVFVGIIKDVKTVGWDMGGKVGEEESAQKTLD